MTSRRFVAGMMVCFKAVPWGNDFRGWQIPRFNGWFSWENHRTKCGIFQPAEFDFSEGKIHSWCEKMHEKPYYCEHMV